MIGIVATIKTKPGQGAAFEQVASALAREVNANEAGCLLYILCRTDNADTYVFMERYKDDAAVEAHTRRAAFQGIRPQDGRIHGRSAAGAGAARSLKRRAPPTRKSRGTPSAISFAEIKQRYEQAAAVTAAPDHHQRAAFTYEAITPEWLSAVLARNTTGAAVVSHTLGPVDDGTSNRRRIAIEWNDAGRAARPAEQTVLQGHPES